MRSTPVLTAIYHMLKNGTECVDLGPHHVMKDRTRTANQRRHKLDCLGFDVTETRDRMTA
jgi:hypothetical protein